MSTVAPGPSDVRECQLTVLIQSSKVIGLTLHSAMTTPETTDQAAEVSDIFVSKEEPVESSTAGKVDAKAQPLTDESAPSQTIKDPSTTNDSIIPASPAVQPPPPIASIPASPAPRRPKPPTKGILKPPPPPGKPTLSNRLRDIAGVAKSLFDPLEDPSPSQQASSSGQANGHGNASRGQVEGNEAGPSVSSAFTAFSGRLGAGFNRLVVAASQTQSSPGQ